MGKIEQALAKAKGQTAPPLAQPETEAAEQPAAPATDNAGPASTAPPAPAPEPPAATPGNGEPPDLETASRGWDQRLRDATSPLSLAAENFRKVRNAILHPASGTPPRTILVTSAVPGEGKSFVCANLGVALAQGLEHHCLLVDCDLRRSTLASLFGLAPQYGLVDYLRHGTPLAQVIVKTGLPKLSLVASGGSAANPAELLDSTVMRHTIMEMAARYPDRYILIDSPPAQAAAETAVLAKQVDAVVLVVRWGGAGREQVKNLVETMGRDKILGVVFNAYHLSGLDKTLYKKGYYGYYGYGYYTADS